MFYLRSFLNRHKKSIEFNVGGRDLHLISLYCNVELVNPLESKKITL